MWQYIAVLFVLLSVLGNSAAQADELAFPQTAAEIVAALSLKDGRTTYNGAEYVMNQGTVYKIIGGKRYRIRGLEAIVDSGLVPKVGALIQFDFDSAQIKPVSFVLIDEFGKALTGGLARAEFVLAGHADNQGSEAYNDGLSERRAQAVKQYLVTRHGVSPLRLSVRAYGERRPIHSNETEEGRALNRRVEFVRVGELE